MDDFITAVARRFEISEPTCRAATARTLLLLKERLDAAAFATVLRHVPGAEKMLTDAEGEHVGRSSDEGILKSLASRAGRFLGGDSSSAGVAAVLSGAGIEREQAALFLAAFVKYVKQHLGHDLFGPVADSLPILSDHEEHDRQVTEA